MMINNWLTRSHITRSHIISSINKTKYLNLILDFFRKKKNKERREKTTEVTTKMLCLSLKLNFIRLQNAQNCFCVTMEKYASAANNK